MTRVGSKCGGIDIPVDAARLFPAIAARMFLAGRVTDGAPPVNDIMHDVLFSLAHGGAGIADDVCASAALYLAEVEVSQPKRWRKDGLAPGIALKPAPRFTTRALYVSADELDEPKHAKRTAVGVLKEG